MSSEKNRITKADLKKIFWRSVPTEHSWNYERQSNCSYCFALLPILKKLRLKFPLSIAFHSTKEHWTFQPMESLSS